MALVTNVTNTVQVPNEDTTVVIRKLSHTQLKEAAKAKQTEGIGYLKELGGELLKALREADSDKIKKLQEIQEADINNYDRDTLLRYGVVSWTYEIPPISVSKEGVGNGLDQLDEPTAKFLAEQIFEFSRPETKAEIKNGLSASITS